MAPSTRSSAASAAPKGPAGDVARLEALARALGLPRPFPSEENRAFLVRETWQQLAAALASQPVAVRPLGYYRTPDSVDIYVFEVALGEGEDRKTWRVYRRYRQFHKYVSSSSELLAGMVVPRLSQAYLKLFSAQTCKDRLEELHAWLQGVVDNTQAFCRQQAELQAAKDKVDAADTSAAAANTNVRVKLRRSESSAGELATTGLTNVRKRERAASNFDAGRPLAKSSLEVQATGGDKENIRRNSVMGLGPTKADKASRQRERTSTYYRLQMDSVEARPLLLLSCFLLSGANCPFPHYFRGLPRFALAMEEINVEIKPSRHSDRGTALFPSRVRSSLATRSGLGLRLVPGHEQDGAFFGATVSGFSRDQNEVDPQLAKVPIGARLVRVNGIDTTSERFDEILTLLSASGRRPLRMRFINNPYATMRPLESSPESDERPIRSATMTTRGSFVDTSELSPMSGISQFRRSSTNSSMLSTRSGISAADVPVRTDTAIEAIASTKSNNQTDSSMRSYSVDARRNSSIFGTVFGDLFGRKRVDTADQAMADRHKLQSQTSLDEALASWDDAGGEFFDILSRGFYTPLPLALLRELREKRRRLKLGEDVLLYPSKSPHSPEEEDDVQEKETRRTLEERRVTGVWSTTTGPLGLSLGACRVCGKEAAMLETTPTLFSSRLMGSEKRLRKGFVLVSINNESTFGWTFKRIASALASAPRPTAVSFRWFKDYSPYLETDFAEKVGVEDENDASMAFASGLDCVAEAQADLSTSLHLALVENASVRDEMVAYETSAREARVKLAASERANTALEGSLREKNTKIAILERQVAEVTQLLDKWQIRAKAAEEKLVAAKQEVQAASERARAEAMAKLAEQEDQLVRESNRSIANANALAERKTQKLLDATVQEMQRKHDEYLQKLAEEHSEEVESLMQQVAVWRHQVEVLTEAEKRNYAALMNNGINPYGGAHRSRFGYENDPANDDFARRPEKDDWRQPGRPPASKPKPSVGNKKEPTFSAARSNGSSSSGASQSQNGTFWDRMVSLLAAD